MTRLIGLIWSLGLLLGGCTTTTGTTAPARSTPSAGMTLEEAQRLVAEFEARQAAGNEGHPLRSPSSLDDVLAVLKTDQLDLFPAGVAFAANEEGTDAEALHAQIELAWGEAQLVLAEVFRDVSGRLAQAVHGLRVRVSSGEGTEKDAERLAALEQWNDRADQLAEALERLAAEHVGAGIELARALIEKAPSSYLGYRVAADYFRLRGDWEKFEEMVARIEETNPESNGLVFLRGTAALARDGDPAAARAFFRQALENDPAFTRAQALLVLSRSGVRDTYAEYQKLRALNPHHQIVVWAGEAITAAFEAER